VSATAAALTRRAETRPGEEPPIRLLIVDDSSVARAVLTRMMGGQPGLQVVASAANVSDALGLLATQTVDTILLDIEMPGGSGLERMAEVLRAGRGARVLIVSSLAEQGADATVRALALGAADTMPKPTSGMFGGRFADELGDRLRRLGRVGTTGRGRFSPAGGELRLRAVQDWEPACIAIGASTGGIHAIHEFVGQLPARLGIPIFVTQHLPPLFMRYFARQLEQAAGRPAKVVETGDPVTDDQIHVAPGTAHLRLVHRSGKVQVRLDDEPAPSGCRPSVDPMLSSIAQIYGRQGVAVMLSGMGRDGLIGSGALVDAGGIVLAQDQGSSAIWGMPRAVAEAGLATAVQPPADLARRIVAQMGSGGWK
jgi:two-component system, chemotaxis family, protein-glutamate methylesterase/glutaminase